ncbi:MAG: GNAT family protein [Pseudomonadota bacterium]
MRLSWRYGKPVELTTERLLLRSVSRRWIARHSHPWTENEAVMSSLAMPTGSWTKRRWRRQFTIPDNRSQICLAVLEKANRHLIGFETIRIDGGVVAYLTVAIGDTDWWGKGVVLETRTAILDYLFEVRGCVRVWGTPSTRNFSSIYNYQRLGFRNEGVLRDHGRRLGGGRSDMIAFGILADEWRALRRKEAE